MAVDNIARGMAAKALENQGGGGSSLPIVNTATVGQTIKVAAVDGDGKPTEWEAGNVSWNDLEDKPFYDNSIVILNKEVTEGSVMDSFGMFAKVSDEVIPVSLLNKVVLRIQTGSTSFTEMAISDDMYFVKTEALVVTEGVAIAYVDGASFEGMEFPSAGTYMMPNKEGFTGVERVIVKDIKTLDSKYLSVSPITIVSDNGPDGATYTADVAFGEAWTMDQEFLRQSLVSGAYVCTLLNRVNNNIWGKHIVMKFEYLYVSRESVCDLNTFVLLWNEDGIIEIAPKTSN